MKKPPFPYVVAGAGVIEVVSRDGRLRFALVEIDEVSILTTDDGPLSDDVFWILRSGPDKLVVPWSAAGADKVLSVLQELEDFDNEAVIEASATSERAVFPVWRRNFRTH